MPTFTNLTCISLAVIDVPSPCFSYRLLVRSLIECSCFQIAWNFFSQAKGLFPNDDSIVQLDSEVHNAFAAHLKASDGTNNESVRSRPLSWPNQGLVRRERYPWNSWEPDRLHALPTLNRMMNRVAPKLEIRVVDLPDLTDASNAEKSVSTQLGVFAKEKINPDEVVLDETSLLTANNKLQDALCDACSVDLPNLDDPAAAQVVPCEECEVVFCSQRCHDLATELYHPALCSADVESIAKNVHATEAADALYSLLLLRAFAMAETQRLHPLELPEIQYIWGDFHDPHRGNDHNRSLHEVRRLPRTLPFSFDNNIRLPLHMLEKMDIDIFSDPRYDVWVFNTLYAKFRGTASARLSGRGGRAIRGPEVGAVHPMWCMANHSCDPNVGWEWGGGIRLWARDERPAWKRAGEEDHRTQAGIEAGQEILNHYCDVDLPVRDRREWARGALGGDCRCQRCQWEAGEI